MINHSTDPHLARFNAFVERMITLSADEQKLVNSLARIKTVKKREFLLREGQYSTECYFVSEGLLRNTVTNQTGNDITTYFAPQDTFVVEYISYLMGTPAVFSIQALEETSVVIIDRRAMEIIHDEVKDGNKMGRLLAESQFIRFIQKHNSLYKDSLEERYRVLNEMVPGIHHRVPQHMIASYLGITRMHLSRLKKHFK